jgi:hypothetical protein
MTGVARLEPRFVTIVPAELELGILYVSIQYATAMHLCACDCGREVVTPLAPDKWSMTFDGASVSLRPSIGNWSFPCRSHYWIGSGGRVRWDRTWSDAEVARARAGSGAITVQPRPSTNEDAGSSLRMLERFTRWALRLVGRRRR